MAPGAHPVRGGHRRADPGGRRSSTRRPTSFPSAAALPRSALDAVGGGHVRWPRRPPGSRTWWSSSRRAARTASRSRAGSAVRRCPCSPSTPPRTSAQTIASYHAQYAPHCNYPLLLDPNLSRRGRLQRQRGPHRVRRQGRQDRVRRHRPRRCQRPRRGRAEGGRWLTPARC